MFTDKIERKDFDKMPKEYRELLVRVLIVQTDSELGGPDLYLERWLRQAPTVQDQLLLAKTAYEEIDHHRRFGNILRDLCQTPEGKLEAQAAVDKMYPRGLDMFGRSDSRRSEQFRKWGIKARRNAESRQAYRDTVDPSIVALGLTLPDPEQDRHFL